MQIAFGLEGLLANVYLEQFHSRTSLRVMLLLNFCQMPPLEYTFYYGEVCTDWDQKDKLVRNSTG